MTTGSDSEIIVQLTADTAQLQTGMDAGTTSVSDASSAMADVVNSAAQAMSSAFTGLTAAIQTAASQISAATAGISASVQATAVETAASSAVIVDAMDASTSAVVDTTETTTAAVVESSSAMASGVESAAASITEAAGVITASVEDSVGVVVQSQAEEMAAIAEEAAAFNAAVQAKIDAMVRLNAAFAGGITSTAGIAEAESALDEAMAVGAITAAEYAGYIDVLNAAELEAATSADIETAAITANTEAKVINARVSGELGTMLGEVLSGNFGRVRRSAGALANQTGLLAKAFTPVGLAVTAAIGAVIAFGVAAVKGAEEQAKFNNALLMTGGAVGVTSGAVQHMASDIGDASGSFAKANEVMLAIVTSGRFTADQMHAVGTAALQMSRLTGESVEKSVDAFVKLQEKPAQAVAALNDKYHFLTASVFDQIEALQQQGDAQGAAKAATEAYASALAQRMQESETQLNGWGKAWHAVGAEASWAWNAMMHLGETDSLDEQIGNISKKLTAEQSKLKVLSSSWGDKGAVLEQTAVVEGLTNQLNELVAARNKDAAAAAAKGQKENQQKQVIDEIAAQDKFNTSLKYTSHLQEEIAEAKKRAEDIHKVDPGSASIKGINFDSSGAVSGGEQWDATVKKLTKEYGENLSGAIRKANAEAKKAARERMNDLEMVRAGTAVNSAERIQADAAVLANATRLYGQNSTQQKAALARMLADEKAYNAAVVKAQQDAAQQQANLAVTNAQGQLAVKRQQIEAAFSLGEMSRQQELAAMQAANEAEYQLEMQAFARELTLLDAKSKATEAVEQKISDLQKKYAAEAAKTATDQQKAMEQSWKKALKPIDNAFQQSIRGMIQGTQTFKKGLDNILLSIVASYAQLGIKTVMDWIASEGAKTSAAAAGAASRATIEDTAATQTKVTDATTGKSQITTAAATGAAKAYQAIVGIPYVGPVLAPIAAGVAFAGIEAFSGMLSSAEGGWERVPADGMMTQLHKNEMVLPATVADHVRNSMGSKGAQSGGGGQIHIHANDARSFKDMLRRNPGALTGAMRQAIRMGHR